MNWLDFRVIRVENRAGLGRYQDHVAAAQRSPMVDDGTYRGRVGE